MIGWSLDQMRWLMAPVWRVRMTKTVGVCHSVRGRRHSVAHTALSHMPQRFCSLPASSRTDEAPAPRRRAATVAASAVARVAHPREAAPPLPAAAKLRQRMARCAALGTFPPMMRQRRGPKEIGSAGAEKNYLVHCIRGVFMISWITVRRHDL